MEKYKFLAYDPKSMEPIEKESSVSNELVKKLQEFLESLNGGDGGNMTVAPLIIDPDDLSIRWGIIETINGQKQLTHRIILKSVNS